MNQGKIKYEKYEQLWKMMILDNYCTEFYDIVSRSFQFPFSCQNITLVYWK